MSSKRACRRKRKYLRGEALQQLEIRTVYKGTTGSIYHCEHYNFWHITKQPRITDDKWIKLQK